MRTLFWSLWAGLLLLKLALASQVPLFVDEGFYWLEGRHLAWAYSDLPGLTAWLVRLGEAVGGTGLLAIRLPFLLLAALVPLLVLAIARRILDRDRAWLAGVLALLLPLGGTLGLFALPDVPLVVAGLLCALAVLRLLERADAAGFLWLAGGLVLGGLAHYRFLGTLGAGFLALLLLPAGRALLRDWRCWLAIGAGALAWLPVLSWNRAHGGAGWRFQVLERHPWELHGDGWLFLLAQPLLVTPLLFLALVLGIVRGWRGVPLAFEAHEVRWLAAFCGTSLVGLFVLGFFADAQRISFHWPLTAELAALPLAALVLRGWRRRGGRADAGDAGEGEGRGRRHGSADLRDEGRRQGSAGVRAGGTVVLEGLGLLVLLAYCAALAGRAPAPEAKWYPSNFAGWEELAEAVRAQRAAMPAGTQLVAGDFKIGAQLGFALGDPAIPVLPHAANSHHGRDAQLALWGLRADAREQLEAANLLLVVDPASVKPRERTAYARALCEWARALPPPRVVVADGGRREFLLFALTPVIERDTCAGAGPLDRG